MRPLPCGCGQRPVDQWGDDKACWECFVIADRVRYERSVEAIKHMRQEVDEEYPTADNVPSEAPDKQGTAEMVSYVRYCTNGVPWRHARRTA